MRAISGKNRWYLAAAGLVVAAILNLTPGVAAAQDNQDCTLIVPPNPLTAQGLATPYQLTATNPANGPCHEANKNQTAFVQAAVIDLVTGQISVYNPLVIDQGTTPAITPTPPVLPKLNVVAIWFGYNANNLSLVPTNNSDDLEESFCTQGLGQFAYCNAVLFFLAATEAIEDGRLTVPPIGTSPRDGETCPTVRSFVHVDQDQSDNVTTVYLFTASGQVAQNTAANRTALQGAIARGNPSDNRLLDVFIDGALGCKPWTVPDLADNGAVTPALPLNELQAQAMQAAPVALVPLGDPFTFQPPLTGVQSLTQVNRYRRGVDQRQADDNDDANTTDYCSNLRNLESQKMFRDRAFLTAFRSVDPAVANTLFTFFAQRYVASYQILNCQALLNLPVNVSLVFTNGIVTDANPQ